MFKKLFGKKKETNTDTLEPESNSEVKVKKRKNEMMSSVLKDSVVESVVSEMFQNERFVFEKDGEELAIGLLLDVDDIGGLSKKQSKDEDKGQLVEQINGSKLRVLITPSMMEEEKIIFIPDAMTLDHMGEFGILNQAPFKLAYVNEDNEAIETDIPVSYDTVIEYFESDSDASDFVSSFEEETDDEVSEEIEEENSDKSFMPPEEDLEDENVEIVDEDVPFGVDEDEIPVEDTYDELSADFDPDYMDKSDYDEYGDENESYSLEDVQDEEGEVEVEEEDVEEEVEVTEEEFLRAVSRTFLSDDLRLEISTDAFDAQFMNDLNFRPFIEDRGEGWMNEYLSLLSQEANGELDTLHKQNLQSLREEYFRLLTAYVERVQRDLDYLNTETLYGKTLKILEDDRDAKKNGIQSTIDVKRRELNEEYTKKKNDFVEIATNSAEAEFDKLYGRQLSEDLNSVEVRLKQEIDTKFNTDKKDMFDARREEASRQLELGITETLEKIAKKYQEKLEQENKIYKEHQANIINFIEENRENDVVHDRTLANELAQSEKADKVMAEMTSKLENQSAEFNARKESLLSEVEEIKINRDKELERLRAQYDSNLEELRKELQSSRDNYYKLTEEYSKLEAKKENEYKEKLIQKDVEKDRLSSLVSAYERRNKKASILITSVALVGVVASLFVGLFFGIKSGIQRGEDNIREQIEQQVEQRVEDQVQK